MIYAGNWHDITGVPFDPGCYARRTAGDGQVASLRYQSHTNLNWRIPHTITLKELAKYWHESLTDEERAEWLVWCPWQSIARDYIETSKGKPFIAFASSNWSVGYGLFSRWHTSPVMGALFIDTIAIDNANSALQQITVDVTYTFPPGELNPGHTLIFQMDPTRFNSKRHLRWTRWIGTFEDFNMGPPDYTRTFDARFPFLAGETVKLVYRHCTGASWDGAAALDIIAT